MWASCCKKGGENGTCNSQGQERGWQSIKQSIVCDSKNLGMKIMEDTGKERLIHEDIWIHTREVDTILGTIGLQWWTSILAAIWVIRMQAMRNMGNFSFLGKCKSQQKFLKPITKLSWIFWLFICVGEWSIKYSYMFFLLSTVVRFLRKINKRHFWIIS